MWVLSLGQEDPLEEGMAAHSSVLAWTTPMDRGAWQAIVHSYSLKDSDTAEAIEHERIVKRYKLSVM